MTDRTYVDRTGYFARWLHGDYSPGAGLGRVGARLALWQHLLSTRTSTARDTRGRKTLDTLIWAWENITEIRQHFEAPVYGKWGGWGVFSRAAAGQASIDPDRVTLAQELLRSHGVRVEPGADRVHFTRPSDR